MRAISPHLRRELEEPRSDEYPIVLLEISHTELAQPIRVANDIVNYTYEDNTYVGFPFQIELVTDSAQVPRGQVSIQNIDQRITEAIRELTTPPTLRIILLTQSDFSDIGRFDVACDSDTVPCDSDVIPCDALYTTARVASESIQPEYEAKNLIFGNVSVNAMQVTGEILSFDMSNEPWPAIRSTADRLPGLEP